GIGSSTWRRHATSDATTASATDQPNSSRPRLLACAIKPPSSRAGPVCALPAALSPSLAPSRPIRPSRRGAAGKVLIPSQAMRIRLLAFASAGDALGAGELELEMPAGSRVKDLQSRLAADFPRLAPLWPRLAVAVDGKLAAGDHALAEGAEVALLPPVSGGSQ